MTVAEADEHMDSQPSSRKRERQRKMMEAAHEGVPKSREERKKVDKSFAKGNITKDLKYTADVRKRQIEADAREAAQDRFGTEVPAKQSIPTGGNQQHEAAHAARMARLLEQRRKAQEQCK
jgi:hypothetical protein